MSAPAPRAPLAPAAKVVGQTLGRDRRDWDQFVSVEGVEGNGLPETVLLSGIRARGSACGGLRRHETRSKSPRSHAPARGRTLVARPTVPVLRQHRTAGGRAGPPGEAHADWRCLRARMDLR